MRYDAVVIGGGFAGLSAATYLGRGRRTVCVIDTGKPRNRFAQASHGFLAQDGSPPLSILTRAREQIAAYPTVRLIASEAVGARGEDGSFHVVLADGQQIEARKAILAFGLRDDLPSLPGLAQRWGRTVLHCPYCHGIEFSDQPLGVLYRMPMSIHQALMVAEWGPTTLYLDGAELPPDGAALLADRDVKVEPAKLRRLIGEDDMLRGIELDDGRQSAVRALYIAPQSCLASPLAEQLGAEIEDGPLGPQIETNADKMTSVPGLYAAGDIARAPHSVAWAVADGVTAGTAAHRALVFG
jgi:thioredoxin reductase